MSALSEVRGGIFYYVQEYDMLGEAFSNALGDVMSIVARDIKIRVSLAGEGLASDIKIKKVYGKNWKKLDDRNYEITLPQLSSELTKDFVFELDIPIIEGHVDDSDRIVHVLKALFQAKGVNEENIEGECHLSLTLLNEDELLAEAVEDQAVVENYLRVLAAAKIAESMRKADEGNF